MIVLFFIRFLKTSVSRTVHVVIGYGRLAESEEIIQSILNDTIPNGNKSGMPINGEIEFKNVSFKYSKNNGGNNDNNGNNGKKKNSKSLEDV